MLCVIWIREVVPFHSSLLLHPAKPVYCHHNHIQHSCLFCKDSSSSQVTSEPCKGMRAYVNLLFCGDTEAALAINHTVIFKDSLKTQAAFPVVLFSLKLKWKENGSSHHSSKQNPEDINWMYLRDSKPRLQMQRKSLKFSACTYISIKKKNHDFKEIKERRSVVVLNVFRGRL